MRVHDLSARAPVLAVLQVAARGSVRRLVGVIATSFMATSFMATGVLATGASTAHATVVVRANLEEMTDLCRRCALATVRSKSVTFDREKGAITTTWTLRVDETWVGDLSGEIAVAVSGGSVPGGTSGIISQEVVGAARFVEGQRVVVFLWKDGEGRFQVLGESQGVFRVTRDLPTGDDICENTTAGLSLVDPAGKTATAEATRLTLTEMRRRVGDARRARDDREKAARDALAKRLANMKRRAEELAAQTRGRPGSPPE